MLLFNNRGIKLDLSFNGRTKLCSLSGIVTRALKFWKKVNKYSGEGYYILLETAWIPTYSHAVRWKSPHSLKSSLASITVPTLQVSLYLYLSFIHSFWRLI